MGKFAILALTGVMTINLALADEANDGMKAATIMAAVTACKTPVSEDLKRALYAKMLSYLSSPHFINDVIGDQIEEINKTITF